MKQSHFSFVALVVTLATASFVHAQEATSTASTTDDGIFSTFRENVTEIRENVQERVENREERRATLNARVQERITNLAANISNRFDGIIARLENIITRLDKRIEKEASEGKDVTSARASLDAAKTAIDTAKNEMDNIDEAVSDALSSTNPREEWKTVRATFLSARDAIKIAHTELRNTIINLKASPEAAPATASSTQETTN